MRITQPFLALPALLLPLVMAGPAVAQPAPSAPPAPAAEEPAPLSILQGRPDAPAGSAEALLGERFESRSAGIAFRPPASMRRQPRDSSGPSHLVQYADERDGGKLVATRLTLEQPMPLSSEAQRAAVAATQPDADVPTRPGVLELTVNQLKRDNPGAEVVRQEVTRVGDAEVALLGARFTVNLQRLYSQQAIVRNNDRLYYTINLTVPLPAAKPAAEGEAPAAAAPGAAAARPDAAERRATEAFDAVVRTIELLDLSEIRAEQDRRLFATRALYVNLKPEMLREAVVGEQWRRILKDGKDIGYSQVVEEPAAEGGQDGVSVEIRTTMIEKPAAVAQQQQQPAAQAGNGQAQPATRPTERRTSIQESLWIALDRKAELWSRQTLVSAGGAVVGRSQIGQSEQDTFYVPAKTDQGALGAAAPQGDGVDPRNPAMDRVVTHVLNVKHLEKRDRGDWVPAGEELKRDLPPFYLAQGLAHLLPRLLPLGEPKGYMFASYNGDDVRDVMSRYLDIGREQNVELGGAKVRAVPVRDRFGWEGSVTTHWVDPQTKRWVGTTMRDSGIEILPTDVATLKGVWENVDTTRPERPEQRPQRPKRRERPSLDPRKDDGLSRAPRLR